MNIKKRISAITVIISCGYTSLSLSAPVTFDFSGYSDVTTGSTFSSVANNHSVEVSPSSEGATAYLSGRFGIGLGVITCYHTCRDLDTLNHNESIILNFDQEITLLSATFSFIQERDVLSGGDEYSLKVNDDLRIDHAHYGSDFYTVLDFGDAFSGNEFEFISHAGYGFLVHSITADFVSEVPEPGSIALLGMGLAVLSGAKRRRQKL